MHCVPLLFYGVYFLSLNDELENYLFVFGVFYMGF